MKIYQAQNEFRAKTLKDTQEIINGYKANQLASCTIHCAIANFR